jgi:hypothetical protein
MKVKKPKNPAKRTGDPLANELLRVSVKLSRIMARNPKSPVVVLQRKFLEEICGLLALMGVEIRCLRREQINLLLSWVPDVPFGTCLGGRRRKDS